MNMKLFGYSISINVIILIGILYLIMVVNAISGSCNKEGIKNGKSNTKYKNVYHEGYSSKGRKKNSKLDADNANKG